MTAATTPPTIGIVGAYGAVGESVARHLHDLGGVTLRVGGRDITRSRALARDVLDGRAEVRRVDVTDPASLADFCAGCRVVVNATGPFFTVLDTVARAALAAGADYVDPSGDDRIHHGLVDPASGRTAVLAAGTVPGLSDLLPQVLAAQGFDRLDRLQCFFGGLDRVTPSTGADLVLSLTNGYGEALAAWRDGRRVSRALAPGRGVELPFFPRPVTAYPFLSVELERLASRLGVKEASWYNVFDGERVMNVLSGHRGEPTAARLAAAADDLARAAALDTAGRETYQLLVFQLAGAVGDEPVTRTLVLQVPDGYVLTGAVSALTVERILAGAIAPGAHLAADVLDPDDAVAWLRGLPSVGALDITTEVALIDDLGDTDDFFEEEAL